MPSSSSSFFSSFPFYCTVHNRSEWDETVAIGKNEGTKEASFPRGGGGGGGERGDFCGRTRTRRQLRRRRRRRIWAHAEEKYSYSSTVVGPTPTLGVRVLTYRVFVRRRKRRKGYCILQADRQTGRASVSARNTSH